MRATGEARELTVRPDGTGTSWSSAGWAAARAVRLTAGERDRHAKAVSSVDLGAIEDDESEPIQDAFGYGISYGGEAGPLAGRPQPEQLDAVDVDLAGAAERGQRE